MNKIFAVLAASTMVFGASTAAFAQAETALAAAARTNACNGAPIVSARYLESGRLEVICPAGSLSGNTMAATGLNASTLAGATAAALILFLILDDDGTATTTSPGA